MKKTRKLKHQGTKPTPLQRQMIGAKTYNFIEQIARLTKDGECPTCRDDDAKCSGLPPLHEPYDMPNDDAVDTVARLVNDARALLK
jgi:hypothetical protein